MKEKKLTVSKERNEDPKRNENILSASDDRKKKHVSLHDRRLKSVLFPPSLAGIRKKPPKFFYPMWNLDAPPSSPKKIDQKERNEIAKPQQNQLLLFVQERSKFQIQKEWNWNSPVPPKNLSPLATYHHRGSKTACSTTPILPRAHIYFLRSIRFGWVNNKVVWKGKAGRQGDERAAAESGYLLLQSYGKTIVGTRKRSENGSMNRGFMLGRQ